MEFKFDLGDKRFEHSGLGYVVRVSREHVVRWEVRGPGESMYNAPMAEGERLRPHVDADPRDAIRWAHSCARRWIENYARTHLALQEEVKLMRAKYA